MQRCLKEAQAILYKYGIDPKTDPDNIVVISSQLHWFTRTNVHHSTVGAIIKLVDEFPYWDKEENIRNTLRLLRTLFYMIDNNMLP